ncbi:MAG: hypothetical protein J6V89_06105 [Acetobacter sp.]|nr:hypothetical protein [Acetobacter sp.]
MDEISFEEKIKLREEKARIGDEIRKKNKEITAFLIIFFILWISIGVFLIDWASAGLNKDLYLLLWAFSILLPFAFK